MDVHTGADRVWPQSPCAGSRRKGGPGPRPAEGSSPMASWRDGLQPLMAENTLPRDRPLGVLGRVTADTSRASCAVSAGVSGGKTSPEHVLLHPVRALGAMPGFLGGAVACLPPAFRNVPSLLLPLKFLRKSETRHETPVPAHHSAARAAGPTSPARSQGHDVFRCVNPKVSIFTEVLSEIQGSAVVMLPTSCFASLPYFS